MAFERHPVKAMEAFEGKPSLPNMPDTPDLSIWREAEASGSAEPASPASSTASNSSSLFIGPPLEWSRSPSQQKELSVAPSEDSLFVDGPLTPSPTPGPHYDSSRHSPVDGQAFPTNQDDVNITPMGYAGDDSKKDTGGENKIDIQQPLDHSFAVSPQTVGTNDLATNERGKTNAFHCCQPKYLTIRSST